MIILGFLLLFFLSSFSAFYLQSERTFASVVVFFITLISGIYFLGWWALLPWLIGLPVGGFVLLSANKNVSAATDESSQADRGK